MKTSNDNLNIKSRQEFESQTSILEQGDRPPPPKSFAANVIPVKKGVVVAKPQNRDEEVGITHRNDLSHNLNGSSHPFGAIN